MRYALLSGGAIAALALAAAISPQAGESGDSQAMSFFITSEGPGDGGNLGGLAGADAHCQTLAAAAGAGDREWRAYLGSSTADARDRIGSGPWYNAKGELIADSVGALHGPDNRISRETGLTEAGERVNGRGDRPNRHDILTGSDAEGRAVAAMTCEDWTSNGAGRAMVGHHDRMGLRDDAPSRSWNASHPSRSCSQEDLRATGGDGLFYCFAAD